MTEIDSFLNRLDDVMYEVWKLKADTVRFNVSYATREKVTKKLKECWHALSDAELIVIRYEKEKKNNE